MTKLILKLFITFLQIGSFSIGGGYAIIPFIQEHVVYSLNWLTLQEYTDIITISQMTPGPLVVNAATFVGIQIAGIPGAVAATLGSTLPGFFTSILLYNFFRKYENMAIVANILKGLRASSVGLIASAAMTIILLALLENPSLTASFSNINFIAVISFCCSLFLLRKYKLDPIIIILLTGMIGLLFH